MSADLSVKITISVPLETAAIIQNGGSLQALMHNPGVAQLLDSANATVVQAVKDLPYKLHLTNTNADAQGSFFNINIMTSTGKWYQVPVRPSTDTDQLRDQIERITKIPSDQLRLVFAGRTITPEPGDDLEDWVAPTMAELEIQPDSTVHLVLALRGS